MAFDLLDYRPVWRLQFSARSHSRPVRQCAAKGGVPRHLCSHSS